MLTPGKFNTWQIQHLANTTPQVTLWGEFAENPGTQLEAAVRGGTHPVLAMKAGRVGDFNGKNISSISSSQLAVDPPELQEAHALRQW